MYFKAYNTQIKEPLRKSRKPKIIKNKPGFSNGIISSTGAHSNQRMKLFHNSPNKLPFSMA